MEIVDFIIFSFADYWGAKDFWPFSISITLTQFPFFVAENLFRDHKKWLEKFYSFHWM